MLRLNNHPLVRLRQPALALSLLMVLASGALIGCSPTGDWSVNIYGEEFIEEGIPAEEFADGWSISFDRFDVSLVNVSVTDGETELGKVNVGPASFDLTEATAGEGQRVANLDVPADTPLRVDYVIAGDGDEGCALQVAGNAQRADERLSFDWCIPGGTAYVQCETDAVASPDAPAHTQLTIHADHLFYDDLTSESPDLRFDLIAAADADNDGEVTAAELAATDITGQARYQVGSADVTDLWAFIVAQSKTVGHIDGEGHCDAE